MLQCNECLQLLRYQCMMSCMSHLAYYDQSNRNPVVPHCFSDLPAAVDVAADAAVVDVAADDAVVVAAAAGRVDWNTSSQRL